jgi:hypothetical protein
MSGAIPPLLNTPSWRGAQLKDRGNFAFYLLLISAMSVISLPLECTSTCGVIPPMSLL